MTASDERWKVGNGVMARWSEMCQPNGSGEEEVTEEMADAGASVLARMFDTRVDFFTRDIAEKVYLAMRSCADDDAGC